MGFFRNLFGRAGRVARGQANKGMDAIETATFEATLKQTIRDMRAELTKVIKASAEAMSNHNRLDAEYDKYVTQADEWKERAVKALKAGEEDLAKKALGRKKSCEQQAKSMEAGVHAAREASEALKDKVSELKQKIEDAQRNAQTLIARRNAARAQKKVAEAMSGVADADNAFAALKDFEEQVKREEAAARAYEDMSTEGSADLEREFEKLDLEDSTMDADLEALKKEIAGK